METFKKLPGVSSFQRSCVISDAVMYNEVNGERSTPVLVQRHGIMGTQNVMKSGKDSGESSQSVESTEVRNLQVTDTAKLSSDATGMQVEFTLSLLDLSTALHSIAPSKKDDPELASNYRASVVAFVDRAKSSPGVTEVARRYARNVLNGRWLFRNRLSAAAISIEVFHENTLLVKQDNAFDLPLSDFDSYCPAEIALGDFLAKGLTGETRDHIKIVASVKLRGAGAIEVFPSQNYVESKPKGFSRSLYAHPALDINPLSEGAAIKIMGYAAIRDQKIGNALRTLDTWYPSEVSTPTPIAVEPMGANLEFQTFFRQKKASSFEILKSLNELDPQSSEGMFIIACLIRGGVYSVGDKNAA